MSSHSLDSEVHFNNGQGGDSDVTIEGMLRINLGRNIVEKALKSPNDMEEEELYNVFKSLVNVSFDKLFHLCAILLESTPETLQDIDNMDINDYTKHDLEVVKALLKTKLGRPGFDELIKNCVDSLSDNITLRGEGCLKICNALTEQFVGICKERKAVIEVYHELPKTIEEKLKVYEEHLSQRNAEAFANIHYLLSPHYYLTNSQTWTPVSDLSGYMKLRMLAIEVERLQAANTD